MMMNLRAMLGVTLVAIGLAACGEMPAPTDTASQPVEPAAISEGETLTDVIQDALADVLRDRDPYSRARRLGSLLPTLGPQSATAVKHTLEDLTLDLRGTELELLLRYWATHEPEEASRWALNRSSPRYRIAAVFAAVSTWARVDPETAASVAFDWIAAPKLDNIVIIALVRGWFAANDPPELRQFIYDLPPGISRQRAIATYARSVIQTSGGEAAERWAESLPDDDPAYKLAVFRRVVDELSMLDIETGVRWCEEMCDGPYGNNMRSIISRNWVLYRDNGPAALAWLSTANEGYERDLAVRLTFALWGRRDREAAVGWMADQINGEEPDPWLRSVYAVYAQFLAVDAPAEAIEWAERVDDVRERDAVLVRVARLWRRVDEAATENWLLQSPLSEEAREQVRATKAPPIPRPGEGSAGEGSGNDKAANVGSADG